MAADKSPRGEVQEGAHEANPHTRVASDPAALGLHAQHSSPRKPSKGARDQETAEGSPLRHTRSRSSAQVLWAMEHSALEPLPETSSPSGRTPLPEEYDSDSASGTVAVARRAQSPVTGAHAALTSLLWEKVSSKASSLAPPRSAWGRGPRLGPAHKPQGAGLGANPTLAAGMSAEAGVGVAHLRSLDMGARSAQRRLVIRSRTAHVAAARDSEAPGRASMHSLSPPVADCGMRSPLGREGHRHRNSPFKGGPNSPLKGPLENSDSETPSISSVESSPRPTNTSGGRSPLGRRKHRSLHSPLAAEAQEPLPTVAGRDGRGPQLVRPLLLWDRLATIASPRGKHFQPGRAPLRSPVSPSPLTSLMPQGQSLSPLAGATGVAGSTIDFARMWSLDRGLRSTGRDAKNIGRGAKAMDRGAGAVKRSSRSVEKGAKSLEGGSRLEQHMQVGPALLRCRSEHVDASGWRSVGADAHLQSHVGAKVLTPVLSQGLNHQLDAANAWALGRQGLPRIWSTGEECPPIGDQDVEVQQVHRRGTRGIGPYRLARVGEGGSHKGNWEGHGDDRMARDGEGGSPKGYGKGTKALRVMASTSGDLHDDPEDLEHLEAANGMNWRADDDALQSTALAAGQSSDAARRSPRAAVEEGEWEGEEGEGDGEEVREEMVQKMRSGRGPPLKRFATEVEDEEEETGWEPKGFGAVERVFSWGKDAADREAENDEDENKGKGAACYGRERSRQQWDREGEDEEEEGAFAKVCSSPHSGGSDSPVHCFRAHQSPSHCWPSVRSPSFKERAPVDAEAQDSRCCGVAEDGLSLLNRAQSVDDTWWSWQRHAQGSISAAPPATPQISSEGRDTEAAKSPMDSLLAPICQTSDAALSVDSRYTQGSQDVPAGEEIWLLPIESFRESAGGTPWTAMSSGVNPSPSNPDLNIEVQTMFEELHEGHGQVTEGGNSAAGIGSSTIQLSLGHSSKFAARAGPEATGEEGSALLSEKDALREEMRTLRTQLQHLAESLFNKVNEVNRAPYQEGSASPTGAGGLSEPVSTNVGDGAAVESETRPPMAELEVCSNEREQRVRALEEENLALRSILGQALAEKEELEASLAEVRAGAEEREQRLQAEVEAAEKGRHEECSALQMRVELLELDKASLTKQLMGKSKKGLSPKASDGSKSRESTPRKKPVKSLSSASSPHLEALMREKALLEEEMQSMNLLPRGTSVI